MKSKVELKKRKNETTFEVSKNFLSCIDDKIHIRDEGFDALVLGC